MHLVAAILKNGRHFEFWNFFRWLTGFIKRAISKEYATTMSVEHSHAHETVPGSAPVGPFEQEFLGGS